MLLILLEAGTMQLLLEFKKKKMVGEKFRSPSKFIIKMEIKLMKTENILDLPITKKNMMLLHLKLHRIVLLPNSSVMNPQNPLLTLLTIPTICNAQRFKVRKYLLSPERKAFLKPFLRH